MSDVVYPVGGGMEDWAYGAAWDRSTDSTVHSCNPYSYPLERQVDLSAKAQSPVKALVYLVEADGHKAPPEWTLGGRFHQGKEITGVYEKACKNGNCPDGHVNRNIRLIYSMVEATDPWIQVLRVEKVDSNQKLAQGGGRPEQSLKVFWRVAGCPTEIAYYLEGGVKKTPEAGKETSWKCYLQGDPKSDYKTFETIITPKDGQPASLKLAAKVDESFTHIPAAKAGNDPDLDVQPRNIQEPQLKLSQERN